MSASEKLFVSRILFATITVICFIAFYVFYTEYATDIQDEVFEAIVDTFPNLDRELAKL